MAKATKNSYKPAKRIGNYKPVKMAEGGNVSELGYSERREYIEENYAPFITDAQMIFSIWDSGIEYDYKADRKEVVNKIIEEYKNLGDYTEATLPQETIYEIQDWDLVRKEIDPETDEVIGETPLKELSADNTYNFSYKGLVDLNWRVYHDEDYDRFFYVITPHLGGDIRGNYGDAIILEGNDKYELFYRFYEGFVSGGASIYFKFKDGSEIGFDSEQDSDVFYFRVNEGFDITGMAQKYLNDFEKFESWQGDEFLEETIDIYLARKGVVPKMMAGGSLNDETPKAYIQILGYDEGKWITITDYSDGQDVIDAIYDWMVSLNEQFGGNREEYEVADYEGFGEDLYDQYMSSNEFDEIIEAYEKYESSDFPADVISAYKKDSGSGNDSLSDVIDEMDNNYFGKYDNLTDFGYEMVSQGVYTPSESDVYITDTDKRIIAGEEADALVDDMSFNDLLNVAVEVKSEYEDEKSELEDKITEIEQEIEDLTELQNSSDDDDDEYETISESIEEKEIELEEIQNELDEIDSRFEDKAREEARELFYDEIHDKLENDLEGWLSDYGYDTDNLADVSFISVDYEKIGDELSSDYLVVEFEGDLYFFNNYAKGGRITASKRKPKYAYYIVENSTKKLVSGYSSKAEAIEQRKLLIQQYPSLRFEIYPLANLEAKTDLDVYAKKDYVELSTLDKIKKVSVDAYRYGKDKVGQAQLFLEKNDVKGKIKRGARSVWDKTKQGGNWLQKQWREADFGDGKGKAKYFADGGGVGEKIIGKTSTGKSIYQKYYSIPNLSYEELKEASEIQKKFAKKVKSEEEKQMAINYAVAFNRLANENKFVKGLGKYADGGGVSDLTNLKSDLNKYKNVDIRFKLIPNDGSEEDGDDNDLSLNYVGEIYGGGLDLDEPFVELGFQVNNEADDSINLKSDLNKYKNVDIRFKLIPNDGSEEDGDEKDLSLNYIGEIYGGGLDSDEPYVELGFQVTNKYANGGISGSVEGGVIDLSNKEKFEMYNWLDNINWSNYDEDIYQLFGEKFGKNSQQTEDIIDRGWAVSRGLNKGKFADGGKVGRERFNLSFNYNPSNISNEDVEKIVEKYTKDWKHDNDFDNVSFYVFNLTKEKADELKTLLKMEDVFNIEIQKSDYANGGGVESLKVGSKVGFLRPRTGRYEYAEVLSIDGDNVNLVVRHPKRSQWDNYFTETKERITKFLNTPSEDWKDGRPVFKVKYADGGYPTKLNIGSIIQGVGFTMLKGLEGGKFYKVVDKDSYSATLVESDENGKIKKNKKLVRHYLDSLEGGISTVEKENENGFLVVKYADGGGVATQKSRVIDYYINNADNEDLITLIGVRDFPNLIGVAEKWVNNRDTYYDKIFNAIDGIHNRTWGENKFVELGLEKFADGGGVESQYKKGVVLVKSAKASNDNDVWNILNEKWKKYNIVNSRAFDLETPYNRGWIDEGISINVYLLKDTETNKYYWDSDYIEARKNKMANGGGVGKMYYHILEYGDYGNIGYHGYYENIQDAEKEVKRLKDFFPNLDFQIFADKSRKEPPITTMAKGGGVEQISENDFVNKKSFKIGNTLIELEKLEKPTYYRANYTNLEDKEKIGSYGSPIIEDVIFDIKSEKNKFADGGMAGLGDVSGMLPNPLPMSTITPMENGGLVENQINELYNRSNFIGNHQNWKHKLLEMLQDESIEAYNIYQSLTEEQKEELLQELFEMDNDMGSDGDGEMETSKENLNILLDGAKNGKKYRSGGVTDELAYLEGRINNLEELAVTMNEEDKPEIYATINKLKKEKENLIKKRNNPEIEEVKPKKSFFGLFEKGGKIALPKDNSKVHFTDDQNREYDGRFIEDENMFFIGFEDRGDFRYSFEIIDWKYINDVDDDAHAKHEASETAEEEKAEHEYDVYDNKRMLKNQAKEVEHHSEELNNQVEITKRVPAWVIAKMERATTDLSDITHYLDGENKMAYGGSVGGERYDVVPFGNKFVVVRLSKQTGSKKGVIIREFNGDVMKFDDINSAKNFIKNIEPKYPYGIPKANAGMIMLASQLLQQKQQQQQQQPQVVYYVPQTQPQPQPQQSQNTEIIQDIPEMESGGELGYDNDLVNDFCMTNLIELANEIQAVKYVVTDRFKQTDFESKKYKGRLIIVFKEPASINVVNSITKFIARAEDCHHIFEQSVNASGTEPNGISINLLSDKFTDREFNKGGKVYENTPQKINFSKTKKITTNLGDYNLGLITNDFVYFVNATEEDENAQTIMYNKKGELLSDNIHATNDFFQVLKTQDTFEFIHPDIEAYRQTILKEN